MVACPICDAAIDIAEGTVVGELMECAECGAELEVVSVEPIKIQEAPEVEEDWGE
ncbi:MAG: lysine biosynthesis protein LysW [Planctomycetota bacterium]